MSVSASSLSFIDGSVLNVALPAIRHSFAAGAADVQWVVNAFTLPLASLILIGGALGDHHGRRLWLVIGTGLFALASLACALSPSLAVLLAGRALQGIGAALLLPNSLALLNGAYEGEARGRAVGIWAAAGAISAAIAPLIGGWLVDHAGWPSIFYINLPFAAAAIAVALARVAEDDSADDARLDWLGAALATASLAGLAYGLTLWSSERHFSGVAALSLAAGVVLMTAFVWSERRQGSKAMIPIQYFDRPDFVSLNLMTFLLYGAFVSVLLLLPYVLITAAGYSPVQAGLAMLPFPLIISFASPIMGKLASRIGPRLPLTVGPVIVAAGLLLGTRLAFDQSYWTGILPAVAVMAMGMALAVAPLTSAVLASVDSSHTGMVSGFNSALSRAGGLVGVALLGAVLAITGKAIFEPYSTALLIAAGVAASAGLSAFLGLRGSEAVKKQS